MFAPNTTLPFASRYCVTAYPAATAMMATANTSTAAALTATTARGSHGYAVVSMDIPQESFVVYEPDGSWTIVVSERDAKPPG